MEKILTIKHSDVTFNIRKSHWDQITSSSEIQQFQVMCNKKSIRMCYVPKDNLYYNSKDYKFEIVSVTTPYYSFDVDIKYGWQSLGLTLQMFYKLTSVSAMNNETGDFIGDFPIDIDKITYLKMPISTFFLAAGGDNEKFVQTAIVDHIENRLMDQNKMLVTSSNFTKCDVELIPQEEE